MGIKNRSCVSRILLCIVIFSIIDNIWLGKTRAFITEEVAAAGLLTAGLFRAVACAGAAVIRACKNSNATHTTYHPVAQNRFARQEEPSVSPNQRPAPVPVTSTRVTPEYTACPSTTVSLPTTNTISHNISNNSAFIAQEYINSLTEKDRNIAELVGNTSSEEVAQNKANNGKVKVTIIAKDGIKTNITGTRVLDKIKIERSVLDPSGNYTDEQWEAVKVQIENYNRKLGGARCAKHGEFTSRGKHAIIPEDIKDVIINPVQCENLGKAYNGTIVIELDNGEKVEIAWISFDHILGSETIIHCAKGEFFITGFHHDYLGAAKKSGKFKFEIIKVGEHGVYKARWSYGNSKMKESTFFPDEWTRPKVIEKIFEALKNKKAAIRSEGHYNRWVVTGVTKEGIIIKTIVDVKKSGKAEIVSAYPEIEG